MEGKEGRGPRRDEGWRRKKRVKGERSDEMVKTEYGTGGQEERRGGGRNIKDPRERGRVRKGTYETSICL